MSTIGPTARTWVGERLDVLDRREVLSGDEHQQRVTHPWK